MAGERDLARLLKGLGPRLSPERYSFAESDDPVLSPEAFALVREEDGVTVIRADPKGGWARISLSVHSSLEAVGLTAALSSVLAEAGISANIVAALRHDHVFVPWDERHRALECIEGLGG